MKAAVLRSSVFSSILLLLIGSTGILRSQGNAPDAPGGRHPLEKYLNPDGTLNLPPDFSGSIDPGGWTMTTGPGGEPVFLPSPAGSMPVPEDSAWDERFRFRGILGSVGVTAVSGSTLYAGGFFPYAGGVTNNIAQWNGTSWAPLGSGTNYTVSALAVDGPDLYVGGWFTIAGGFTVNGIARWDGVSWAPLGTGTNGIVLALAVVGSDVYAGGTFTTAGGNPVNYIAKWNGGVWSSLGTGMNGFVYALTAADTNLYVGGSFSTAGGLPVSAIAKWNGSTWSAVGTGMTGSVSCLASDGTNVFAGGNFQTAGGDTVNNIARWNGSAWSAFGSGLNGQPAALAWTGSALYAAGSFDTAGGVEAANIARWDGSSWSAAGSGTDDVILALAAAGPSEVFIGGPFHTAGGIDAEFAARWDGSSWSPLYNEGENHGVDSAVTAVAAYRGDVYIGGTFTRAGGVPVNRIAKWNGAGWDSLGSGITAGTVSAIAVRDSLVFVGGSFASAGGTAARNIAVWNGSSWSALGTGVNGAVLTLHSDGQYLYAGGTFDSAGGIYSKYIALWNGASWLGLGTNMPQRVVDIETIGSALFACTWQTSGGFFPIPSGYVMQWNGASWTQIAYAGVGAYYSLAAAGGKLFAAGPFTGNVEIWDGVSWTSAGAGMNSTVNSLVGSGSDVYAGGWFSTADGSPASCIARWDGATWSPLGSGTNSVIHALAADGTDLYAGGGFTAAGDKPSIHFAHWTIARAPDWEWAAGAGGTSADYMSGIATDDSGNVYVTGYFSGPIDFGAGTVSSDGLSDIFLAKYNRDGVFQWARTAGGTDDDVVLGIAVDNSGGIVVAGAFRSSPMDFDTVSLAKPDADYDIFLARYDGNGNALWARAAGGSSSDFATALAVDGAGNAFVTGQYLSDSLQFGANAPVANAGSGIDMFLAKYDPAGTPLWSRSDGGTGNETGNSLAADSAGNVWCAGSFTSGTFSFGANPALTNNGSGDAFFVMFDTGGAPVWSRGAGNGGYDYGKGIGVDQWGNVYAGGSFGSTSIAFDTTVLANMDQSGSSMDLFIAKYSPVGDALWARRAGGHLGDSPTGLAVDASGSAYQAGFFGSPVFPIGGCSFPNPYSPQNDLYVARYDSGGTAAWVRCAGSSLAETPAGISLDRGGNVLVSGMFYSPSVEFGTHEVFNQGSGTPDLFVAKLGANTFGIPVEKGISLSSGWNIVSLPVNPAVDSVNVLFPGATSSAYAFTPTGYETRATMEPGAGYWLKYPSAASVDLTGASLISLSVPVFDGWNLVGSISSAVEASSISSTPPGLITGSFFAYHGGYQTTDTIHPGEGYWVKVTGDGTLDLGPVPGAASSSRIRIVPTSDLPPAPPVDETADGTPAGIPARFALEQNYPNPFNPSTLIRYQLPVDARVRIGIFNVLGEEVATLVNEVQRAGYKSVEWNASGIPSGVYFYRLSAGDFKQARKLVIVK